MSSTVRASAFRNAARTSATMSSRARVRRCTNSGESSQYWIVVLGTPVWRCASVTPSSSAMPATLAFSAAGRFVQVLRLSAIAQHLR